MNKLQEFLIGIRFVGLKATLRTIQASILQARMASKFGSRTGEPGKPVRPGQVEVVNPFHNGAFFIFGHGIRLEVAFLSNRTARLTWTPGKIAPKYAVGGDETIALRAELTETEHGWSLMAGDLMVKVTRNGEAAYYSQGKLIRTEAPPVLAAPSWTHEAPLDGDAVIYGLGERTRLNLRPGSYHLWNQDPSGSYGPGDDPLYVTIPVYYCQQPAGGYLLFYENTTEAFADFGESARLRFTDGALRFYLCAGDLPVALEEFTRLTGRSALPPRWALGFHQCRWGYESAEVVRKVLAGFRQNRLPLDAFHFDIDYMDGYRVFSTDAERYPDFDKLLAEMKADDIHPVVILDPGVKRDPNYGVYASGVKGDHFVKLPNGDPLPALVWPGWVHFPDFTRPETRRWWGSYYQRFLEDGVEGFWHDMNEPAVFSAWGDKSLPRFASHNFEGREGDHLEAHNIYGLQMNAAAHNAIRNFLPDKRPWLLTRSGWAGVQRYAWKWTGDVESTWAALRMTIGTVLGLGISGVPYSGSDIGGFSGDPEPELYIRWFQMSALMAFFRNHAAIGSIRSEPWQYGRQATDICREMLFLRKRLMPYLYTLSWDAALTGAPFARPLAWAVPEDPRFWEVEDAYLLGNHVLVAPVVEAGAQTRRVLLPEGGWVHYWDDQAFSGGEEVEVPAPLERIPFFIKAGSVFPMLEDGRLTLHLYPPLADGEISSHLYSDEGEGYGASRVDQFSLHRRDERLFLQWRSEGNYPLPENVRVVLHGVLPQSVRIDEQPVDWPVDGLLTAPFENLKIRLQ